MHRIVGIKFHFKQRILNFVLKRYFVGNMKKGWISERIFQANEAHQIFRKKRTFLTLRYAHYQEVRNVRFLEKLAWFVSFKHPFWDSPSCLLPTISGLKIKVNITINFCLFKLVRVSNFNLNRQPWFLMTNLPQRVLPD